MLNNESTIFCRNTSLFDIACGYLRLIAGYIPSGRLTNLNGVNQLLDAKKVSQKAMDKILITLAHQLR